MRRIGTATGRSAAAFAARHSVCRLGHDWCTVRRTTEGKLSMEHVQTNSEVANTARKQVLTQLIADHKLVLKIYRDFQKLDPDADAAQCQTLVKQAMAALTVHATLEEELLYPAARGTADDDLLNEAEVEHESMHALIERLNEMAATDDKYAARFTVLCEYLIHHVDEEEEVTFPQLERGDLDWITIAVDMDQRRAELTHAAAHGRGSQPAMGTHADGEASPPAKSPKKKSSKVAFGFRPTEATRGNARNASSARSAKVAKPM
jgi:hemerythrin superfamily protein